MSDAAWERLPADTKEVCWRDEYGWSKEPPHCGKRASWAKRGTCGCGACDMTIVFCEDCYNAWISEQKRTEEWAKRNVVVESSGGLTLVRRRRDQKDN